MPWQSELRRSISTIEQLQQCVALSSQEERRLRELIKRHPMRITRYYASLIDWNDPNDPIRRMAVPSLEELDPTGSYDPSDEKANTKMPGLQHKYPPTALVLATNRCAMYCRHCFRKRLVGLTDEEVLHRFSEAVRYITQHQEINNVLISGGDPLILSTRVLGHFLDKLSKVPHLRFIRIGSRVPVTFPERILGDAALQTMLRQYSRRDKRVYITTHFNHPREITEQAIDVVAALYEAGVIVNNQAVLLNGVNDDPQTMVELQNRLAGIGANPYYVFQCRPVKRVKHGFQVPLARGHAILEEAKRYCNGYSKRFRYIMSDRSGKIEIIAVAENEIYMKYHEAKHPRNNGRFFKRPLTPTAGWLDDLPQPVGAMC